MEKMFKILLKMLSWPFKKLWKLVCLALKKAKKKGWIAFVVTFFVLIYALALGFRFVVEKIQSSFGKQTEERVEGSLPQQQNQDSRPAHVGDSLNRKIQNGATYTTPVREHNSQAVWVRSANMFRDDKGFFITPPGVEVEGRIAFEEFAFKHPDQARIILGK